MVVKLDFVKVRSHKVIKVVVVEDTKYNAHKTHENALNASNIRKHI